MNANQLTTILKVDYRTVRHHLDILEKNGLITPVGERYGKLYFPSFELEQNLDYLEEILNKFGTKLKKNNFEQNGQARFSYGSDSKARQLARPVASVVRKFSEGER